MKKKTMKKKLQIAAVIVLALVIGIVFVLCYRAGANMTSRRMEKEEQQRKEEAEAHPSPTPVPELTPTPEPRLTPAEQEAASPVPERRSYSYWLFDENMSSFFSTGQIDKIKSAVGEFLNRSEIHPAVHDVTCTEYHDRSQTRNQVYGYLKLDDDTLLQYTYDFDSDVVKVMETAVTLQKLEDKKKADAQAAEAQRLQEEEDREKERLAQEIFGRSEGGSAPTPTPAGSYGYQAQQSGGSFLPNSSYSYPPAAQNQNSQASAQEILEEQISEELVTEDFSDEIAEEQIPEDAFTY